jgi:hypothetical protein
MTDDKPSQLAVHCQIPEANNTKRHPIAYYQGVSFHARSTVQPSSSCTLPLVLLRCMAGIDNISCQLIGVVIYLLLFLSKLGKRPQASRMHEKDETHQTS